MSISLLMHSLFLMIFLRCHQNNLSGPGVKELLYLLMALMISAFEKRGHLMTSLLEISFKRSESICWFCAELNKLWSTSQSSSSLIHRQPLYWMASIVESFLFLTQFMSSHGLHFLLVISSIFHQRSCVSSSWPFLWISSSLPTVLIVCTYQDSFDSYNLTKLWSALWC